MLPIASDEALASPLAQSIRERRGGVLYNLDKVMLHSEAFARGWGAFYGAIRGDELAVSHLLRELAILYVAVLNGAEYEWQQHEQPGVRAGASPAMLEALRAKRTDAACFDELQRATLCLAEEMTVAVKPRAETVERLRALLSTRELVELIGTISAYNCVSRFLLATGVELEK